MAGSPDRRGAALADPLHDLITHHRAGEPLGLPSICSAHPLVLQAAMEEAAGMDDTVLVEATSNQVNQFGGYTGMHPRQFRDLAHGAAASAGLSSDRVILGGDHLGPNPWRDLRAEEAMTRAEEMVREYVAAGFTKIHLDCSMACSDDAQAPSDEVVAKRSMRLMQAAEQTAAPGSGISYVIGTEVPTPGGAAHKLTKLQPTSPDAALRTLRAHHEAASDAGLEAVWPRVRALVVQPGVEFDHTSVVDYERAGTAQLRSVLEHEPGMVFEAHSTDYQTPGHLRELVEDHWAILKVGPGLTFALREALVALAQIEQQLLGASGGSRLLDVVDQQMLADDRHWRPYYDGDATEQKLARLFSFSDRIRYYWPVPEIQAAQQRLFDTLSETGIPLPLLSQYLPAQYARVRERQVEPQPQELVVDHIKDVLRVYAAACMRTGTTAARTQWPQSD